MAQDRTPQERSKSNQPSERNVDISDSGRGGNSRSGTSESDSMRGRSGEDSGGITNRSLEEEICEQEELPERGSSRSERISESDQSER